MENQRETVSEQVILVGISSGDGGEMDQSLDELAELVQTAGGTAVGRLVQAREQMHPATYIGKGKLEELSVLIDETGATGIVCDDELSPAQLRGMEQALDTKIMDRTLVILDIFAGRANTAEGKIQVELAQLKYRQARLVGLRSSLSRLGGGIGTRGPGEKKLEMDRRLIKTRIAALGRELAQVRRHREVTRKQREKSSLLVAAIVGYTNAGKSTLLNALTGAGVLEEDKLFATLDATTRKLLLTDGQSLLLTDTVGFIHKLPHNLIEAFQSTLEEARYADIILHVVDAGSPAMDRQMYVVYETLRELGVEDKTILTLFNKQDTVTEDIICKDLRARKTLSISARTGEGLDALREELSEIIRERRLLIERLFAYEEAGKIQRIREAGQLLLEEYRPEGIFVRAYVPDDSYLR